MSQYAAAFLANCSFSAAVSGYLNHPVIPLVKMGTPPHPAFC